MNEKNKKHEAPFNLYNDQYYVMIIKADFAGCVSTWRDASPLIIPEIILFYVCSIVFIRVTLRVKLKKKNYEIRIFGHQLHYMQLLRALSNAISKHLSCIEKIKTVFHFKSKQKF